MSDIENLFVKIGLDFAVYTENANLFRESFTHRSVTHEGGLDSDNELLEFLGDAVLELITTEWLFQNFPELDEGKLTTYRSALVKRENLAQVARKIDLGRLLRLSRGEARAGGRDKDYLLANVVEAVIGALYLSGGIVVTKDFVLRFVITELDEIIEKGDHIDAKSELQEITQGKLGVTPSYQVLSEKGKDHEKEFGIGVFLDEALIGQGTGRSKKEAQTEAAVQAVKCKSTWLN
jgi:ribonuclease-3